MGLIAASWAKLTGLLLIGAMLGVVIAYLMWRQRLSWSALVPIALAFALAAAAVRAPSCSSAICAGVCGVGLPYFTAYMM